MSIPPQKNRCSPLIFAFAEIPQKIPPKKIKIGLDYQEDVCYTYHVL